MGGDKYDKSESWQNTIRETTVHFSQNVVLYFREVRVCSIVGTTNIAKEYSKKFIRLSLNISNYLFSLINPLSEQKIN